jgi:hypothetical protein
MTGRMNWRRASLQSRPKTSIKNESDGMERDAAARWLAKHSWKPKSAAQKREHKRRKWERKQKKRWRKIAARKPDKRCYRDITLEVLDSMQTENTKPPWED